MTSALQSRTDPEAAPASGALPQRLEVVRKLAAALMLGRLYGLEAETPPIFLALSRMLGGDTVLRLGEAVAAACTGNALPAQALLRTGGLPDAYGEVALLCVALAWKNSGRDDWRAAVDEILAVASDPGVARFARFVAATTKRFPVLDSNEQHNPLSKAGS